MKLITRDTDYAVRALCYIAGSDKKRVSSSELVRELKISRPFLRKILQILNKSGLLESTKGPKGGFTLEKSPDEILFIDIIQIFQGPLQLKECVFKNKPCPEIKHCQLKSELEKIEQQTLSRLESITLSSLLEKPQEEKTTRIIVPRIGEEVRLEGLAISQGISLAKVCLFNEKRHEDAPRYKVDEKGAENEKKRFRQALTAADKKLKKLAENIKSRIGKTEAEIFLAQNLILQDPTIHQKILHEIQHQKLNAESAIIQVLDFFESQISELDDEYIKERASDIGEVKRRLLDVLANIQPEFQCEGQKHCLRGRNRIVVAKELTPGLTVDLNTDQVRGFVTERGGTGSHAGILARALGIPAVSGIRNIHNRVFCGTEVLVNGDSGEVIVFPTEKTVSDFEKNQKTKVEKTNVVSPVEKLKVLANLNQAKDVESVLLYEAEGIGLYRTEFEFFSAQKFLSEDEQFEKYRSVLKAMRGKPVYFRLLDVGGDKKASFWEFPKEGNPYLGFRGSRFLLHQKELFQKQARALARASEYGQMYVMYPMIIELKQFLELKKSFMEAASDLPREGIKHGVMFEVPSACLEAEEILREADFASIGSNDLIQYLFAVDRDNELVAYDYNPDREIFWNLIRNLAEAARQTGKPLSLCGEIAGNPKYTNKLLQEGISTVSVSPILIPDVRLAVK